MSITEPTVTELTIIESIEINPPQPEQPEAPKAEAQRKPFLCRHIFVDGHQCGSRALRGQHFCYYHYAHRTPVLANQRRRQPRSGFDLTRLDGLDNHTAIQLAISEVLGRVANESVDPKRAWLLLYGLQIAGHNLRHARPNPESPVPDTIVEDGTFGQLAEIEPGRSVPPSVLEQMRALLDKDPSADLGKIADLLDENPNADVTQLAEELTDQFTDQRPIADLPIPEVQTQPLHIETLGLKDRGVGGASVPPATHPPTNPQPAPTTQSGCPPDHGSVYGQLPRPRPGRDGRTACTFTSPTPAQAG